eukprot:3175546-Pyramimonas_sp.AAC.1
MATDERMMTTPQSEPEAPWPDGTRPRPMERSQSLSHAFSHACDVACDFAPRALSLAAGPRGDVDRCGGWGDAM